MAEMVSDVPGLVALWDEDKNERAASAETARSHRAAWWKFSNGHSFQRSPRIGIVRGGLVGLGIGMAPVLAFGPTAQAQVPELVAHGPSLAASELFVDGDAHTEAPPDQCPGDGSDASPFRSLECAMASGAIRPGTAVLLRDAEVPYDGIDSADHVLPDGGMGAPISIRPAPGHAPILVGPIVLVGLDHWELHDLVLDGSGGGTPTGDAIRINGEGSGDVVGVRVEGTTIRNWPGRGIVLRGTSGSSIQQAIVNGNRIEAARDTGIWVENAHSTQVTNNEISEIVCLPISFTLCDECGAEQCAACGDCLDEPPETCGATTDHDRGQQSGLRVLGDSTDTTIDYNYIHDFLDDDCGPEGTRTAAMFLTGSEVTGGLIDHNFIERIAPGNLDNGYGILMFQSTSSWVVERNVLGEIGHCALCEGDDLFYGSLQVQWLHNTITQVAGAAIDIRRAVDAELRGNVVLDADSGAVRVWAEGTGESLTFEYNLYWNELSNDLAGRWGNDDLLDLGAWQGACGCDASSVWDDPGFPLGPPLDVTPAYDGPAIDLAPFGEGLFHGIAPDAGALEPPLVLGATIAMGNPNIIRIALDNQVEPELQGYMGCVGFTVESGAVAHPLDSCTIEGAELLAHLAEPIVGYDPITLTYMGGAITDGANIGGRLGASLHPFELAVVNESPIPPPDEDDTGGDTTGADGGSMGSGEPGGGDGEDGGALLGCGCRGGAPRPAAALGWLLLLAGWRRAR